jgi:hypothetical protein
MIFDRFTLCTSGDSEGVNKPGEIPLDWFFLRMMVVAKNKNILVLINMNSTP